MYEIILETELFILNSIHSISCSFLDSIFLFITHLGDKGMLWILLGLCLCFSKKHRKAGLCMLLALLISFIICNLSLKPLVARIRPYEYVGDINLLVNKPSDFSFPSGHSSSSFAAAFGLWLSNKKWGRVCLIIAGMIAFSRLYLFVHFPSDVLAGIILGIFSGFMAYKILTKKQSL
jgi:undecaprenyl-diphosphatase